VFVALVGVLALARGTRAGQSNPTVIEHQQTVVQRLNGSGNVLRPPSTGAAPLITAAQAWQVIHNEEAGRPTPDQVTATLAEVTTEQMGATRADNSVDPMYKDLLVWVIEWPDTRLIPVSGPVPSPGMTRVASEPKPCPAYFFVDARSGKPLFAQQDC
jgi:hypothetical protein